MTTLKNSFVLSVLLSTGLLAAGCTKYVNIPLVASPVKKKDLCGSAKNCGLDYIPLVVNKETPLLTEGPKAKLGGWLSSPAGKQRVFQIPVPCAVRLKDADFFDRKAGNVGYAFDSAKKSNFSTSVKARLGKDLSKYLTAEAATTIERARKATQDTDLTFEVFVTGIRTVANDGETVSAWHRIEGGCIKPNKNKYEILPRQVSYLVVSGSSKTALVKKLKVELKGAFKSPEELEKLFEADVNVDAQIEKEIEKSVDAVISENEYLLGISY